MNLQLSYCLKVRVLHRPLIIIYDGYLLIIPTNAYYFSARGAHTGLAYASACYTVLSVGRIRVCIVGYLGHSFGQLQGRHGVVMS